MYQYDTSLSPTNLSPDILGKQLTAISPYIIEHARETVSCCKFWSNVVKSPDTEVEVFQ